MMSTLGVALSETRSQARHHVEHALLHSVVYIFEEWCQMWFKAVLEKIKPHVLAATITAATGRDVETIRDMHVATLRYPTTKQRERLQSGDLLELLDKQHVASGMVVHCHHQYGLILVDAVRREWQLVALAHPPTMYGE